MRDTALALLFLVLLVIARYSKPDPVYSSTDVTNDTAGRVRFRVPWNRIPSCVFTTTETALYYECHER